MSASDWFKCHIHSQDPDILRLHELTGEDPHTVVGRCVDWFRWIDQHLPTHRTTIRASSLKVIIGSPRVLEGYTDYVSAMVDVGWISVSAEGAISVLGYEDNFSKSAKNRSLNAKRQADFKSRKRNGNAAGNASPLSERHQLRDLEERRREETEVAGATSPPNPPEGGGAAQAAAAAAHTDGVGTDPPDPTAAYRTAAYTAVNRWSVVKRGHPMRGHQGEDRPLRTFLDSLAEQPPIVRSDGASLTQAAWIPFAVEVCLAEEIGFENVRFVVGCLRNRLDKWAREGPPGNPRTVNKSAGMEAVLQAAEREEVHT